MRNFFKGVRKHIAKLDVGHLREQYELVSDELSHAEKLLNALKEGFIRLDASGAVIQSNPAAKELLGVEPEDALPSLGLPHGVASRREVAVTYPEARTLEVQTIPLDDETIVYMRDITAERARTEEELRLGATKAVRDLAAGVAHEIGNPLNAIAMNLQLLERDPTDVESIEICKTQVKRLDGIIRGFLQALRPARPTLRPCSVEKPIRDCLDAFRSQFEERRVHVSLDLPPAMPAVAIDPDQMQQVFFNLIKNSLEAMKDGSSIDIAVHYDDSDVVVVLSDTGPGIPAEQLGHIFEPYRTSKEKGTGLGLMVSKRIVNDHGGTISVESAPGEGTSFTIRLPRIERRVRQLK